MPSYELKFLSRYLYFAILIIEEIIYRCYGLQICSLISRWPGIANKKYIHFSSAISIYFIIYWKAGSGVETL